LWAGESAPILFWQFHQRLHSDFSVRNGGVRSDAPRLSLLRAKASDDDTSADELIADLKAKVRAPPWLR